MDNKKNAFWHFDRKKKTKQKNNQEQNLNSPSIFILQSVTL